MSTEPSPRREKLRADLIRWLWSDRWTDEELDDPDFEVFDEGLKRWACDFAGHEPARDQCGIPAHDFCRWCGKSMPNSWQPITEETDHAV